MTNNTEVFASHSLAWATAPVPCCHPPISSLTQPKSQNTESKKNRDDKYLGGPGLTFFNSSATSRTAADHPSLCFNSD